MWEEAREYALPPERVVSPLAGRPYDLRHACITRWLNAGVPIAEVARRVGNSPQVIHRRYHGCIDGHEEAANAKIARAMEEAEALHSAPCHRAARAVREIRTALMGRHVPAALPATLAWERPAARGCGAPSGV